MMIPPPTQASDSYGLELDFVHPVFRIGVQKHEELDLHVCSTTGHSLSRNSGRIFVPGDCCSFDIGNTVFYELYAPCDPCDIIGTTRVGELARGLTSGVPFVVLAAFRDDQGSQLLADPYPLISMLVVTRSYGVCWLFYHMLDDHRVVTLTAQPEMHHDTY